MKVEHHTRRWPRYDNPVRVSDNPVHVSDNPVHVSDTPACKLKINFANQGLGASERDNISNNFIFNYFDILIL